MGIVFNDINILHGKYCGPVFRESNVYWGLEIGVAIAILFSTWCSGWPSSDKSARLYGICCMVVGYPYFLVAQGSTTPPFTSTTMKVTHVTTCNNNFYVEQHVI